MIVVAQLLGTLFDVAELIAAFGGGAFGAALGPLPAFIFTGFMVIAGEAATLVDPDAASITTSVAFGPPFSPAISFAGGVAATAYAARQGYMDTDFDYHEAKNIAFALGTRPDVLAVGGAFGILGYWLQVLSGQLGLPWDPIAMGVVLSALFHRLILGYSIVGKVRGSILDMSPFEDEERRVIGEPATDGGEPSDGRRSSSDRRSDGGEREPSERDSRRDASRSDGGEVTPEGGGSHTQAPGAATKERFVVEPWLPHQYRWGNVAMIGLAGGILGAYVAVVTGSAFLAFGISAATLVFLNCGVEQTPVTHHITLPASTAALAVTAGGNALIADAGLALALIVGLVFGVVCALFGELFQRVFYAHGDTHWDPPAAAIVFGSFLIAVLYLVGVFPTTVYVPVP